LTGERTDGVEIERYEGRALARDELLESVSPLGHLKKQRLQPVGITVLRLQRQLLNDRVTHEGRD